MDGVRQVKGKDAPWVTEDAPAVMDQLTWLNELSRTETELVIIASHDEEQHINLTRQQLLSNRDFRVGIVRMRPVVVRPFLRRLNRP